ncbi:hypothetical protein [Bradyrhizobium erythrophlei]|uniref:Uncharacterized protein n=1 Tax=Bradyrhizobium erythrophlei TaxID=1437360 RepID=A0A1M5NEA6_9BRAD|nr:hypothetical protein [Bradyrhizobium erythrophlei]SHG87851.1 hypothetical protein SAMN05443248_2960 [Bradyrhizobium erythrophlei]
MKLLLAFFRIRHLLQIEQIAGEVTAEIDAYDRALGGTPPRYNDSKPPDADDYNAILSITERLRR